MAAAFTKPLAEGTIEYNVRRARLITLISGDRNPLPRELIEHILCLGGYIPQRIRKEVVKAEAGEEIHPASIPPSSGVCPFVNMLSSDVRRVILADSLPPRDTEFEPLCAERGAYQMQTNKP